MKKSVQHQFIALACFLLTGTVITAQQLTPFAISSSGGFSANTSGMMSYTVGEMSAIQTLTSSSGILTQGFQQPDELSTAVELHTWNDVSYSLFPNPSDGNFSLVVETEDNANFKVKILNVLGVEILRTSPMHSNAVHEFDLSKMPQGIYFIICTEIPNYAAAPNRYFIEKIQIVR